MKVSQLPHNAYAANCTRLIAVKQDFSTFYLGAFTSLSQMALTGCDEWTYISKQQYALTVEEDDDERKEGRGRGRLKKRRGVDETRLNRQKSGIYQDLFCVILKRTIKVYFRLPEVE